MKRTLASSFFIAAILLSLLAWTPPQPVHAASLVVNTLVDENDGSCLDGDCSLRDAIAVANDSDVITFSVTGTITLTGLQLEISKNISITGPGSSSLTVSGNNLSRIFRVNSTYTVSISGMTMTNGRPDPDDFASGCGGGAIYNQGFLTLNDVVITNNASPEDTSSPYDGCTYPRGGGIINWDNGSLTITNSTISNNNVYSHGGGIFFQSNEGTLTMTNVLVDGNSSTAYDGGGIYFEYGDSAATLTDVTVSNNTAANLSSGNGGGVALGYSVFYTSVLNIYNSTISMNEAIRGGGIYVVSNATLTLTDSTVSGNTTSDTIAKGGGVLNDGNTTITNSTVSSNTSRSGGGIFNNAGILTITGSTVSGNDATATSVGGGGIYNQATITITNSTIAVNEALADNGGGIANDGILTITDSTINDNYAFYNGGGIFNGNGSTLTIADSTIANNSSDNTSGGGGGILNGGGVLNITNSTISSNSSADDGGGVHNSSGTSTVINSTFSGNSATNSGGNLYVGSGTFNLSNSIIANSTNGGDCVGVVSVNTNNMIEDAANACGLLDSVNNNIIGSDPNIAALANNGGSTQTHALLSGSLAIDAGDATTCANAPVNNLDQRGTPRPQDSQCDIGAYEKLAGSFPTFADVPTNAFAWAQIESIYAAGITGGCGGGNYCPGNPVTRAQMAVFLLRGIHGSSYTPPAATGTVFNDVGAGDFAAAWIEQLVAEGVTSGCGGGNYCPGGLVTRAQMAVFLLRAKHGSSYTPPAATGTVFNDIPSNAFAAAWIEQLVAEGVTSGCGGGNYCPGGLVTRAQMAVFLQRTFALPMP